MRPCGAQDKPWALELDKHGARLWNERDELVLTLPRGEVPFWIKVPSPWDEPSHIEIAGPSMGLSEKQKD